MGLQRERSLFAPLIIDDPREPGDYDVEFVVVLDDWIDDVDATPDEPRRDPHLHLLSGLAEQEGGPA